MSVGGVEARFPDLTMRTLAELSSGAGVLEVLCIGAHCDDIEIGCGATLLRLATQRRLRVTWMVLCATPQRAAETEASAARFLRRSRATVLIERFPDGYLPAHWAAVKDRFETLKREVSPDLVFTHESSDRHQDHRVANELTWNTFRDHAILEYEIPKYDGGLGQPNFYVPVTRAVARRKVDYLQRAYASQRARRWFNAETFVALMRLRGVECNAPQGLAEAFHAPKVVL